MRRFVAIMFVFVSACTAAGDPAVDAASDKDFDLRFKWVDAFPAYYESELALLSSSALTSLSPGVSWSPAELDAADGAAHAYVFAPVDGGPATGSTALSGAATGAASALAALPAASVVMSLDLSTDAFTAIVDTPAATSAAGTLEVDAVAAGTDLPTMIASLAATDHVVTAIGFDGTSTIVASSELADAPAYAASVLTATTATLPAQAAALATAGFTITAVGRTSAADDYLVVGTRVAGETTALTVVDAPAFNADTNYLGEGFASVALYTAAGAPRVLWQK